jgi:hypothetical protein
MNDEEKKYEKLINDLKNLPSIKAPENFEADILRKIHLSEPDKKENFWKKIFTPGKLVPAAVAIASAIIIFIVIDIKPERPEDPLSLQPRLREDVIKVQNLDEVSAVPEKKTEKRQSIRKKVETNQPQIFRRDADAENELSLSKEGAQLQDKAVAKDEKSESLNTSGSAGVVGRISPTAKIAPVSEQKKENFNFLQINLSPKEKQEVEKLKEQLKSSETPK